jgi:hypothetical protein
VGDLGVEDVHRVESAEAVVSSGYISVATAEGSDGRSDRATCDRGGVLSRVVLFLAVAGTLLLLTVIHDRQFFGLDILFLILMATCLAVAIIALAAALCRARLVSRSSFQLRNGQNARKMNFGKPAFAADS